MTIDKKKRREGMIKAGYAGYVWFMLKSMHRRKLRLKKRQVGSIEGKGK
jgi:hypothetical protein